MTFDLIVPPTLPTECDRCGASLIAPPLTEVRPGRWGIAAWYEPPEGGVRCCDECPDCPCAAGGWPQKILDDAAPGGERTTTNDASAGTPKSPSVE